MDVRRKKIMTTTNSENISNRTVKVALAKPAIITRRPALGEVGNKITTKINQNEASKKPVLANTSNLNRKPVEPIKTRVQLPEKDVKAYASKQLSGVTNVDEYDDDDPMLVAEYVNDIMKYLLGLETKFSIRKGFLTDHSSTARMRSVLVNWIAEIHINFKFLPETFHLSVGLIDRYLQENANIGRETLQLVGTAATWTAAKYEEMFLPDLNDFVYICDEVYSKKQIMAMERDILKRLKFGFGRPLSLRFLRRYNKVAQANRDHHSLGKYLLDLALLEYGVCHIKPSVQAAAACCLSISVMDNCNNPEECWTDNLIHYSTYKYSDIKDTVVELAAALVRAETSKYQSIRSKFASSSMGRISLNPKVRSKLVLKLAAEAVLLKI